MLLVAPVRAEKRVAVNGHAEPARGFEALKVPRYLERVAEVAERLAIPPFSSPQGLGTEPPPS